jgi:hypothetical protein
VATRFQLPYVTTPLVAVDTPPGKTRHSGHERSPILAESAPKSALIADFSASPAAVSLAEAPGRG